MGGLQWLHASAPSTYTQTKKNQRVVSMYTFNKNWNQKHTRTCKTPCCIVHTSKNLRGRCISAIMLSFLSLSLSLAPIQLVYYDVPSILFFFFLYSACGLSQGQIGQHQQATRESFELTKRMHDFLQEMITSTYIYYYMK